MRMVRNMTSVRLRMLLAVLTVSVLGFSSTGCVTHPIEGLITTAAGGIGTLIELMGEEFGSSNAFVDPSANFGFGNSPRNYEFVDPSPGVYDHCMYNPCGDLM